MKSDNLAPAGDRVPEWVRTAEVPPPADAEPGACDDGSGLAAGSPPLAHLVAVAEAAKSAVEAWDACTDPRVNNRWAAKDYDALHDDAVADLRAALAALPEEDSHE